jgi:hypothetical protein
VIIAQVRGDLNVNVWDQPTIAVEADGRVTQLYHEGDALMISEGSGDLELYVPADAEIIVTNVNGDVSIQGVRRVELENIGGDVELLNIGINADREKIGEAIALTDLRADLKVTHASSLRTRGGIRGDVSLEGVALAEIETVGADLSLESTEAAVIGSVGGDLDVVNITDALSCGSVGGDCQVHGSAGCEVAIGNIGGDIEVNSASSVHIGSVVGACELRDVKGIVEVGNVGAEANFYGVGGDLQVGSVGADAELRGLKGAVEVGNVGGDLELQAIFPGGSCTGLNVGGD